MLFQLVRLEISEDGNVIAREETQPLFELQQDAMAMAEFEAARCYEDYRYSPALAPMGLPGGSWSSPTTPA